MKKHLVLAIVCSFSALLLTAQTNIPAIRGWSKEVKNNSYIFSPAGNTSDFTYEIKPLQTATGDIKEWLQQKMKSQITTMGLQQPAEKDFASVDVLSFNTCAALVTDNDRAKWMISAMAYKTPAGKVRYAVLKMPGKGDKEHMNIAIQHFIDLSKQEGKLDNEESNTAETTVEEKEIPETETTTSPTIPGALKPADIKGVVMHMEYGYGVGGMMIVQYRPYLLLTNGKLCKRITVNPYELDVASSEKAEPEKWGTWKLEGKTLVVQLPNDGTMETKRWDKNWFWTKPATNAEKITGAYNTIGGGGNTALGGTSMIVTASNITFNNKGQFTLEHVAGDSSSDAGGAVSTYAKKNTAGTYILNGYSIEMHYNNGTVVKKLFYFYPDSHTTFAIGGEVYTPAK